MRVQMSLLEYLLYCSRPHILSDLHAIDGSERMRIVRALERVAPEDVPLEEWNDALGYLAGGLPELTAQAAKEQLIHLLSQTCDAGRG